MSTRNYNTETTSPTSTITNTTTSPAVTITTTNHSTDTTTSPTSTITTNNPTTIMPGAYAFIIITYNDGPEYTRRIPLDNYHFNLDISDIEIHPMSVKIEHDRHMYDVNVEYEISGNRITGKLESIMEYNYIKLYSNEYYYFNMSSTTTTKKPLHISIGVNYRGFIKYSNITDISNTLSLTTTKISKYVINVGKLAITSTSSTSTLIDAITLTPTTTASTTTTKADTPKPTSIPPIRVNAADNDYHDGDVYLTYESTGAVYENGNAISLPATLTPTYDNSDFIFSSKYDWYYMKNGEKVEVLGGTDHKISLSVLYSTIIYIKVTSTTTSRTSSTSTVTETTTVPDENKQSITTSSTEPATTQTPTPAPSNTSTLLTDTTSYTTT